MTEQKDFCDIQTETALVELNIDQTQIPLNPLYTNEFFHQV